MKTALPRFEGRTPAQATVKISGATDDRVGCLAYEEEVYFVGKGVVAGVDHTDVKDVFTRVHKIAPSSIVLLERSDCERVLTEGQMLADERSGVQNLFTGDGKDEPGADGRSEPPGEEDGE